MQTFDTESATPGELCAEKCARQAAADCPKTPAGYAESCTALCESKYSQFPACESDLRPLDACGIESVTYSCSSAGVLTASPTGACAEQGLHCANCTGDVVSCL